MTNLTLRSLPDPLAICRLSPDAPVPDWAWTGGFFSITRTPDELSLVVAESVLPSNTEGMTVEPGWRALMVVGPLDFALTGILASLTAPLAQAGIPLFALSTFDTDYLLIKAVRFDEAVAVLLAAGHTCPRIR